MEVQIQWQNNEKMDIEVDFIKNEVIREITGKKLILDDESYSYLAIS